MADRLYLDTPYAEPESFWRRAWWWLRQTYRLGEQYKREQAIRDTERRRILAALDAACLGRTPEQSLRKVTNFGRGFWMRVPSPNSDRYISTHVDADLASLADAIARLREESP